MMRAAVVVVAALAAFVSIPPRLVERVYSARVYPVWQPIATRLSNLTPVAVLDVLIIVVLLSWIGALAVDLRRRAWIAAIARAAMRTITWGAAWYLLFLLSWGLNYRRVPLVETLQFDQSAVSRQAAIEAATAAVSRLNELYEPAHRTEQAADRVDPALAAAFARALGDLGRPAFVPGRPKGTLLDPYFRRAGVEGMTDPYLLETLVTSDLLPVEQPFVVAHEWSHLAGIADEGEASFVGWMTCMRGGAVQQYSGALFAWSEVSAALAPRDRAAAAARLDAGPREDLAAIARRHAQHINPRVASAGWTVYDQYLKANRVERGTSSYGDVVRLLLGVRFSEDGSPLKRAAE
jgi:hypothetical protein